MLKPPLVSCGLPHVLTPGSLKRSLLRVRLGSALPRVPFGPLRCPASAECEDPFTPWHKTWRIPTATRTVRRQRRLASNMAQRQRRTPATGRKKEPKGKAWCGWRWTSGSARVEPLPRSTAWPHPRSCRTLPRFCTGLHWATECRPRLSTIGSMHSRPTSCSSSSTSGRRSTSRRPALTPRWTPERARLPRRPCLAADRVTVACAYVRSTVATALGRSHAVGATEGGQ